MAKKFYNVTTEREQQKQNQEAFFMAQVSKESPKPNMEKKNISITLPSYLIDKVRAMREQGERLPDYFENIVACSLYEYELENGKLTADEIFFRGKMKRPTDSK